MDLLPVAYYACLPGGFPGWERHPNPPLKLISELTASLQFERYLNT